MNKIVPALLTDKKEEFTKMLGVCKEFTNYVQIDIMDGEFVPSRSITIEELKSVSTSLVSEAHLMVKKPLEWLDTFKAFGARRIIYHFEIGNEHLRIISEIKKQGLEAGIAINPLTEIDNFRYLAKEVKVILFMSVNPGFYGSSFIPEVLEKIKKFKKEYPHILAGIDGGIKLNNIKRVAASGVDYICVGSAIFKAEEPKEAYLRLRELS